MPAVRLQGIVAWSSRILRRAYLIYLAVMEGFEIGFRLPWAAIGIAVLSVFLVVGATMMYSMSKIKKDNPIDALKNENL